MQSMWKGNITTISIVVAFLCIGVTGETRVIVVDQAGGGDYTTIQRAIDGASYTATIDYTLNVITAYADTIFVSPGMYFESISINKDIFLMGAGPDVTTIMAINSAQGAVQISGSNVKVAGLTIGVHQNVIGNIHGIVIMNLDHHTIVNNVIIGNGRNVNGIDISSSWAPSYRTLIGNNVIRANRGWGIFLSSFPTALDQLTIANTIIVNNTDGGIYGDPNVMSIYNDVYNNGSSGAQNYSRLTAGLGDISLNPLFINPDTDSLADVQQPAGLGDDIAEPLTIARGGRHAEKSRRAHSGGGRC